MLCDNSGDNSEGSSEISGGMLCENSDDNDDSDVSGGMLVGSSSDSSSSDLSEDSDISGGMLVKDDSKSSSDSDSDEVSSKSSNHSPYEIWGNPGIADDSEEKAGESDEDPAEFLLRMDS